MLIVFGGLPGSGKTTLAKAVAKKCSAVYLRIDTIEMAIHISGVLRDDIGPAGYVAAYWVAKDNLRLGCSVVTDSVNPLQITRDAWARIARNAQVPLVEVEVICSDAVEHQRRIEHRVVDPDAALPVTWAQVCNREYERWSSPHLIIDTAQKSIDEAQQELMDRLAIVCH